MVQDPLEFRKPSRELSEARKADLREPWQDPTLPPVTASSIADRSKPSFTVNPPRPGFFGFVDKDGHKCVVVDFG